VRVINPNPVAIVCLGEKFPPGECRVSKALYERLRRYRAPLVFPTEEEDEKRDTDSNKAGDADDKASEEAEP